MNLKSALEFAALATCLFAAIVIIAHCTGCKHVEQAAGDVARVAEEKFRADMFWCVHRRYPTDAETDACLDAKRHSWGIETVDVRDAGAE